MTREPLIIDYRRTFWGHDHTLKLQDDGTLTGFCWYRQNVREGDVLLWLTEYGHAEGRVVDCKPCMDPDDMYKITVRVVARIDKEGARHEVEQDDRDSAGQERAGKGLSPWRRVLALLRK